MGSGGRGYLKAPREPWLRKEVTNAFEGAFQIGTRRRSTKTGQECEDETRIQTTMTVRNDTLIFCHTIDGIRHLKLVKN